MALIVSACDHSFSEAPLLHTAIKSKPRVSLQLVVSLEPGPTLGDMVTTGFGPGTVKIDAYVTITFSKLSAKIWLTDNASFAPEPTSGREQNVTTHKTYA